MLLVELTCSMDTMYMVLLHLLSQFPASPAKKIIFSDIYPKRGLSGNFSPCLIAFFLVLQVSKWLM